MSDFFEKEKTYTDGFHIGYLQAIADGDARLRLVGDDRTVRRCRQVLLEYANVKYDPAEVMPRPDWRDHRVIRAVIPDAPIKASDSVALPGTAGVEP